MTAPGHCPTCFHHHQIGPTGRLVCGGSDGDCRCDPSGPCRCAACTPAPERKPVAGWRRESEEWERYRLTAAGHVALAWRSSDGSVRWRFDNGDVQFGAPSIDAAKLAAEDALIAVHDEISRAVVGR